ncbi:MAG: hypothetical protein WD872_03255 [Pirellulaceae bacterium]
MRLTLRTMLAYLDNVLDPNDAEELGRKIQESEFAGGLVQRVRTVTKKVRMSAPKVDGKGMGNDANTVAEYLDSALPQDRVGDFERVCLESDAHLAEVAGCHQILALVLGKPADVSQSLRDKMYGLGSTEPAAGAPPTSGRVDAPPVAAAKAKANGQPAAVRVAPQVPDYLRAGRRASGWQWVLTAVAALLLGLVILRSLGPFNASHPIAQMVSGPAPIAEDSPDEPTQENPPDASSAGISPSAALAADEKATRPRSEGAPVEASDNVRPVEPPTAVSPVVEPVVEQLRPTVDLPPAVDPPSAAEPDPAGLAVLPAIPEPPEVAPAPKEKPLPLPAGKPTEEPPAVALDVGRFSSDDQIMALQIADGVWQRVAPQEILSAGMKLVALPAYRPQIALASGVQMTFNSESSVELHEPSDGGASRMTVDYGRLLAVTVGAAGAQIDLDLGGVRGTATLVDADSALAISVKRYLPPGADPLAEQSVPVVEIFNMQGRVHWDEMGQERASIPEQHVRIYVGSEPPETLGPFAKPDWIDAKSIAAIDRDTALALERLLDQERPLNVALLEATEHRQVNVRALAARCLSQLNQFEPILKDLNDARQYSFWAGEFAALRQAIVRDPRAAELLKTTLEGLRPDHAEALYRLLLGYSPDQLAKGSALDLVKHLESEQMDIRVLAFQNLVTITGAMEFYMPQKRPADSQTAIRNWRLRGERDKIHYVLPLSPIDPYKPLDRPPAAAAALSSPRGAVAPLP